VVRAEQRVVLGTEEQVAEALGQGTTAETVNTSYVERYHGTQRHAERPQGPQGLHLLQGAGLPRGGDVAVRDVLQLRLDAPDAAGAGAGPASPVPLPDAGDGGGLDRP
jgi:hypothetical protein